MCNHEHVTTEYEGGVFLSCGEYDDDYVAYDICLDCGEILNDCTHPDTHFEYEPAFDDLGEPTGEVWACLVCDVCSDVLDVDTCVPADFLPY